MRAAQIIAVLLAVHTAVAKPSPTPVISPTPLQAAAWGIYAAIPDYPLKARRQRITGTRIFYMEVQIATGTVQKINVERSTGSQLLDAAVLFRNKWDWVAAKPPTYSSDIQAGRIGAGGTTISTSPVATS